MYKMSKILAMVMAGILCTGVLPSAMTVSAAEQVTVDNIVYELHEDYAVLYECQVGDITKALIPETVNDLPVTEINKRAFAGCGKLIEVTIPKTVKTIGNIAFSNCFSLPNITIPENVEVLGEGVFGGCTEMEWAEVLNPDCEIADDEITFWAATVLRGKADSTLQTYAEKHNRKFEVLDEGLQGDVNKDDKFSVADAIMLQRILAEDSELDAETLAVNRGDMDKDGMLTLDDLFALLALLKKV